MGYRPCHPNPPPRHIGAGRQQQPAHNNSPVPPGQSKKLHHPWSGPFEIVKRLTDATYRIANQAAKRQRFVVHFNRLKPCVSGTHFNKPQIEHNTDHDHSEPNSSSIPFGTHLQLVDNDDPTTTRRYPQRIRRPPDRLHEVVSHWIWDRYSEEGSYVEVIK